MAIAPARLAATEATDIAVAAAAAAAATSAADSNAMRWGSSFNAGFVTEWINQYSFNEKLSVAT